MSNIKDLLNNYVSKNTAFAYILLLTNVLGLVAFLESKTIQQVDRIKQSEKEISDIQNEQVKAQQEQEKPEENTKESFCIEQINDEENKELNVLHKDNVIDFKEAIALKAKEAKQPLKSLVWRFPK